MPHGAVPGQHSTTEQRRPVQGHRRGQYDGTGLGHDGVRVQSVERALSVLEAIAKCTEPPTVAELAKIVGIDRTTTWRMLNSLVYFDLVVHDEHSGRYKIGYGALRLAAATDGSAIARRGRPVLELTAQRTDGTAFLEATSHGGLIMLDECRSRSPVTVDLASLDVPHHCGSAGKLYLASLPADELDAYLAEGLEAATSYTHTEPARLREEIAQARTCAVAYNYKEHREEWCGITAAVRDLAGRDLVYLNVTLPTYSTTEAQLHELTPIMMESSAELAARLR